VKANFLLAMNQLVESTNLYINLNAYILALMG
jgi:hypothetical protein